MCQRSNCHGSEKIMRWQKICPTQKRNSNAIRNTKQGCESPPLLSLSTRAILYTKPQRRMSGVCANSTHKYLLFNHSASQPHFSYSSLKKELYIYIIFIDYGPVAMPKSFVCTVWNYILYRIAPHCIVYGTYRIITYRIVLYYVTSYHRILHHIISYIISYYIL